MLKIFMNNSGIIVGSILLLSATVVIPGRLRWYVFTAGLAIVVFHFFQIRKNKIRFKEANAKREELHQILSDLKKQHADMEKELQILNGELNEVKTQQNLLIKESIRLSETNSKLAAEISNLEEKDRELMTRIHTREAAIKQYNEAKRTSSELKEETDLFGVSPGKLARQHREVY